MAENEPDDGRSEHEVVESILDSLSPAGEHREATWELAESIRNAGSAARGVDVFATEVCGYSASDWAAMTDRDRSTVARNVRRANE